MGALDTEINRIQCQQDGLCAGPLAGHRVGMQTICGQRTLVTRAPQLVRPMAGEFPAIEQLILGLLDDAEHDQISYLMGWLKVGYESPLNGQLRPGQALAMAGPSILLNANLREQATNSMRALYASCPVRAHSASSSSPTARIKA